MADPEEGSTSSGWSGTCSGTGDCQVTLDADKNIITIFIAV